MSSRFIMPFADVGRGITPSSGAKLFFYADDGVTLKDTYSDQLTTPTPNSNPVVADSTGVFGDIYLSGSYKVTLTDNNNTQIFGGVIVEEIAVGNLTSSLINDLSQAYEFATVALMKASIILPLSKVVTVNSYYAAVDSDPLEFIVVAAGTGVDDGGLYIDHNTLPIQFKQRFKGDVTFRSYGCVGDGLTSDQTQLQAAMDGAYSIQKNLYGEAGTYLVTGLTVPGLSGATEDRDKGWRMHGQGFGEPFVTSNTGGCNIVSVTDAPVLVDQLGVSSSSSNGTIEIDHLRFDGTSTTPVISFVSQYGLSSFHNCAVHQRGTGGGYKSVYAPAVAIYEVWCTNSDFTSIGLGAARTGIGFDFPVTHDGGLLKLNACTARGWNLGYKIGGGGNSLFLTEINMCEASTCYQDIHLTSNSKGAKVTYYGEGGEDGYGILDEGDSSQITNCNIGAGHLIAIDATSITAKGSVISDNTVAIGGKVNGIGIDVASSAAFGGYNKTVSNNYIAYTLGTTGVTGINVSGVDPRLSVFNNSFDTKTAWSGTGTNKIVDNSNGVYGIMTAIDGSFEFPVLSKSAMSLHKSSTALTQSDVSTTTLTLPTKASYFAVSATAAVSVNQLVSGLNEAKEITLRTTTANMTFTDSSLLSLDGAVAFTGPGILKLIVEEAGGLNYAYEISRTVF